MPGRGEEAGPGKGAPADVEVNWEALRALIDSARPLTAAGRAAAVWALRILEDLLGHGWVRCTRRETGWLPGELTYAGFHRVALPQLLATATRLDRFRSTPGFDRVVRELRRNPSPDRWRHMLLQLEIARAAAVFGGRCEFEPRVEGSTRFADVLVHADGGPFIVETTTVFRDDLSRRTQEYEDQLADYLRRIEVHYGVSTRTQLDSHQSDSDTEAWLARVETAARHVRDQDNAIKVSSSAGVVVVSRQPLSTGTTTFSGVALTRDGLRRFVRTLLAKSRQSAGPQPAWLRVDVADGLWQFTDWAHAPLATKLDLLGEQVSLALHGRQHLLGVAVSSGPLVDLHGAVAESTGQPSGPIALRRVLSPAQVREILLIPLRPAAGRSAQLLTAAYDTEPAWLDEDLVDRGLATKSQLWTAD